MKRNKLFHSAVMGTSVALESIDFQPTEFPDAIRDQLVTVLEKAKGVFNHTKYAETIKEEMIAVEAIIKKYTGLTIQMHTSGDFTVNAMVSFRPTNHNNVLFSDMQQIFAPIMDAEELLNIIDKNNEVNTVDIGKATVSGVYSKLSSKMILSLGLLKHKEMTPEKVTAVIMHEIGHVFALFEYTNRQIRTNQVMAAVVIANRDRVATKEFQSILIKSAKALGGNGTELNSISNIADNNTAIATIVIDAGGDISKSALGIPEYDHTSFEMLADQFVSRHRYGRHLLDALDLLPKNGEDALLGQFQLMMIGVAPIIASGGMLFITLGAAFISPFAGIIWLVITASMIFSNSDASKNYTYDDLKVRFKRIREQSLALLKTEEATPETAEIIANIKEMDKVIDKTYIPPNYLRSIIRYFSKKNRNIAESIQFQRDMEELAHNDLFLKAKELQTL